MCGILCLISDTFVAHPLATPNSPWETKSLDHIRSIFKKDLVLSAADLNKLNHQDKLRELNNEIIKIGNDVKVDQLENIARLKQQMKDLIGDEVESDLSFDNSLQQFEYLIPGIAARGPDYLKYDKLDIGSRNVQLFSSVLSLRQPFTPQPCINDRYVLQFNGEIYDTQADLSNDTEYLMQLITEKGVELALKDLNGELAVNIIDLQLNMVYFCRDSIGKRSLCFKHDKELLVSSIALPGFLECEARVLYKLDLKSFKLETTSLETDIKLCSSLSLDTSSITPQVNKIHKALRESCLLRQETIFPLNSNDSDIAVLFSGGIDCTIISACLIENFIATSASPVRIDLLTVGFDNPRTGLVADKTPDRELSVKSWFHLVKKYQHHNVSIRLIEINIDYKLWLTHKPVVKQLIFPQQTEMDLSISMAFYFASNNLIPCKKIELSDFKVEWDEFITNRNHFVHCELYVSEAKVLFSGLGADELFGGYSRHRVLFSRLQPDDDSQPQYEELKKLLMYDIDVIYKRNLGRDDRVISSWGKELRYPYLDINFIRLVNEEIEANLKIKLEWNTNKKGKLMINPIRKWILRELAGSMGLDFVKNEEKRAIQFGSKSAKLEIGQSRSKGTDDLQ